MILLLMIGHSCPVSTVAALNAWLFFFLRWALPMNPPGTVVARQLLHFGDGDHVVVLDGVL